MKIQSLILSLLLSYSFFSCSINKQQKKTVISGEVQVIWSKKFNLRHGTVSLADSWSNQKDERDSLIPLKKDGKFEVHLNLKEPRLYSISHEQRKVEFFVFPGDSIHIDLNSKIEFSGSNYLQNNHLNFMNKEIENIQTFLTQDESAFFKVSQARYYSIIDSLKSAYIKVNDAFKKTNQLSNIYDEKIINEIDYRTKFHEIVYPGLYELYTGDTIEIDQSYYDNITQGSFKDPKLLELNNYVLFLDRFLEIMAAGELKFRNYFDKGIQKIKPKYEAIQKLNAHQEIKEYLMHEHLKKSIHNYGIAYLENIITDYKSKSKNPKLKQSVLDLYSTYKERRNEPDTILIYKRIGNIQLEAHVFNPKGHKRTDKTPVYAFFHGGGWSTGIPEWGYQNCKRYREKGMVAVSFEYRLIDIHESNLINCIEDAKSAILWLRKESESLGIDPNKVVAAGFSAGGHLAASTAILEEFETRDVSGFTSIPNAFIVHSATYDTTKNDFFKRQSNGNAQSISTTHNVSTGLPPSISFHGTRDHLAPISEFNEYRDQMENSKNDFRYKVFEGVGHFFNNPTARKEVSQLTDKFLERLDFIKK